MIKNTAGQFIGAQMISATDGSAFTGEVTAYVTGDAGTQAAGSVGSGACTHEGNGFHTYALSQAETNYDHVAVTFTGTGAIPATLQVYPSAATTGSGAYFITVTVTDGTDALQNAKVRLTEGANTYTGTTDASGNITFSLDAATYTVAITKSGYTFTPVTRTVTSSEAGTLVNDLEMTLTAVTPSAAGKVTGVYNETLDETGVAESGVVYSIQCVAAGPDGVSIDEAVRTVTSNGSGVAQFTNLVPTAKYQVWRASGRRKQFTCPAVDFEITGVIGE